MRDTLADFLRYKILIERVMQISRIPIHGRFKVVCHALNLVILLFKSGKEKLIL